MLLRRHPNVGHLDPHRGVIHPLQGFLEIPRQPVEGLVPWWRGHKGNNNAHAPSQAVCSEASRPLPKALMGDLELASFVASSQQ